MPWYSLLLMPRWFMYSHRIVAFFLFTSLFFISSSLFAGIAWFILSFQQSATSSPEDKGRKDLLETQSTGERHAKGRIEEREPDDDLTISHSVTAQGLPSRSTLGGVSQTYPRPPELSTKEEPDRGFKGRQRSEASVSDLGDDDASVVIQFKEESTSGDTQDYDAESIDRRLVSERSI